MRQQLLSPEFHLNLEHGGVKAIGKRKMARPFSSKASLHLVLRSSQAVGEFSFLRKENSKWISNLLKRQSKKHGIIIYEFGNSGNHLHLLIRAHKKKMFNSFLKVFTSAIAMKWTGGKKTNPSPKFWDHLPWTRIVAWGKAYWTAKKYVIQNRLEGLGVIPYQPRKRKFVPIVSGPPS